MGCEIVKISQIKQHFFLFIFFAYYTSEAEGIGCFLCTSINGSDPLCEDPFFDNLKNSIFRNPCLAGLKGRNGVFPASACVKIKGNYQSDGVSLYVRGCSIDSGSLTMDTELNRTPHMCGSFMFTNRLPGQPEEKVFGCIEVCNLYDGCNNVEMQKFHHSYLLTANLFILFFNYG